MNVKDQLLGTSTAKNEVVTEPPLQAAVKDGMAEP